MKGPETTRSYPKRNLFCLYEGPKDPICSTYMKGPETTRSLPKTDLFYLYEGPRTTRSLPNNANVA